jgi:hypothetical protein
MLKYNIESGKAGLIWIAKQLLTFSELEPFGKLLLLWDIEKLLVALCRFYDGICYISY